MRQFIYIATASLLATLPLVAGEPTISNEEAKKIFQDNTVEAQDMEALLEQCAGFVTTMFPTSLSTESLIQMGHDDYRKQQESYLAIVKEMVDPKDVEGIIQLLDNPLYLKYRNALWQLNVRCITEASNKMQAAAIANPETPETVVASAHPIVEIQKENYDAVVIGSKYVVVDVYADWCGPCKMLAPTIQSLSDELGNLYTFTKVNVSEDSDAFIQAINVKSLPTIIFYKEGKEVGRISGIVNKERLKTLMNEYFKEEKA